MGHSTLKNGIFGCRFFVIRYFLSPEMNNF